MTARRFRLSALAVVAALLLAACGPGPLQEGEVGDTFRLEFTKRADDVVDVTVVSIDAVTREQAEDWNLHAFSDPDGVAARTQDFYFVRVEVAPVEGRFEDFWFIRSNWSLVTDDGDYRGDSIFPPEPAGCDYDVGSLELCIAIAVPSGTTVDAVRLWGAVRPSQVRPRPWAPERYAEWNLPS